MRLIKELYDYREMIYMMVRRDLRSRYKGSILGFFWTFLNPLLQIMVYGVVFSTVMRVDIENFYIYLFVGFVPWFMLSSAVNQGATCIQSQSNLVEKIYFPRMVLPLSTVLTCFVNMLLSELVVFAVLLLSGFGLSGYIIALPPIMLIQLLFVFGIVLVVSACTVYVRDLAHILEIVTMAWFYATPICYTPEMLPEEFRFLLYANPMSGIVDCYRQALYYKEWPDLSMAMLALSIGVVTVFAGGVIFQHLQKGFAEEL